ncbi:hypothetical protein HPB49_025613 [Dermacentor silvarum]|uniref:Uncharacterized protein n=1 Tax=Dermacentor silvarum TaxID=543639 RepID=A0ACB8DLC5_DERSI|nr:hypothetical protein HPB49_025613 [Dermacentor silvarum]
MLFTTGPPRKVSFLFSTVTGLKQQPKEVQAATFLVIIGEEGRRAFYTFKFEDEDEKQDADKLIKKFEAHYKPATNLTFNEFRFVSRDQRQGEAFNERQIDLRTLARQSFICQNNRNLPG